MWYGIVRLVRMVWTGRVKNGRIGKLTIVNLNKVSLRLLTWINKFMIVNQGKTYADVAQMR